MKTCSVEIWRGFSENKENDDENWRKALEHLRIMDILRVGLRAWEVTFEPF